MRAKWVSAIFLAGALAFAGSKAKTPPVAGGENETVRLSATLYADKESVQEALGNDLGGHYIVVAVRAEPKYGKEVPVLHDLFILRTNKDGERTAPFAPSQIAGKGALVLHSVAGPTSGMMGDNNGPVWGGVPGTTGMPQRLPGNGGSAGTGGAGDTSTTRATVNSGAKEKDNPLLQVLKDKELPEKKTTEAVSGLLYFPMEKQKQKDLELSFVTQEGKLYLKWK